MFVSVRMQLLNHVDTQKWNVSSVTKATTALLYMYDIKLYIYDIKTRWNITGKAKYCLVGSMETEYQGCVNKARIKHYAVKLQQNLCHDKKHSCNRHPSMQFECIHLTLAMIFCYFRLYTWYFLKEGPIDLVQVYSFCCIKLTFATRSFELVKRQAKVNYTKEMMY